jgi:hypothetical protein
MTYRFAADDLGCFRTAILKATRPPTEAASLFPGLVRRMATRVVSRAEAITVGADMFIFLVVTGPGAAADPYGSCDKQGRTQTKKAA